MYIKSENNLKEATKYFKENKRIFKNVRKNEK